MAAYKAVMSAGHECVGGTCGSDIVSSAAHVLGMRGVCEMCMCLARGSGGGQWIRELDLGFINPVGTGNVGCVSAFELRWCGWGVVRGLGPGS